MPEQKKAVVPRLRFPEFRDAGPWEVKRLGEVVLIANGLSVVQNNEPPGIKVTRIETISDGFVNITKVGYIKSLDDIESYKLQVGDILFSHINSLDHIGKCAFVDQPFDLYHGMNLLRFQVHKRDNVPKFIYYVVCSEPFRSSIRSRANQAVNQASINQTEVGRSRIALPPFLEQQKIADCLSSLDEVIELEAKKLEALQAHKKGLMQQLFPREGETTPRLRFPEFRDAGPWENIQVSDFGTIVTGKTPSTSNPKYWNGRFAWVTPTDISNTKYIYTTDRLLTSEGVQLIGVLPENTVLITCIASIGKNAILKVPGSCNQQINAIIPNSNFNSDFIYYLFCKNQTILQNQAGTSATAIIPKSAFEKLYFHVPKLPEQQKIADCLSSLDELIELQAKQLEALQTHKKGLMQQLFPQEIDL
ncbi:restriction endonuclease subunit S [Chloracidobacterium thermophilum]|nr:restriction endonuclease subunit S [Chloracidobacterium thermophilum]QUV79953.1 restriction endonuclease subunit S [Chloracidobacterium thermophilum]